MEGMKKEVKNSKTKCKMQDNTDGGYATLETNINTRYMFKEGCGNKLDCQCRLD